MYQCNRHLRLHGAHCIDTFCAVGLRNLAYSCKHSVGRSTTDIDITLLQHLKYVLEVATADNYQRAFTKATSFAMERNLPSPYAHFTWQLSPLHLCLQTSSMNAPWFLYNVRRLSSSLEAQVSALQTFLYQWSTVSA